MLLHALTRHNGAITDVDASNFFDNIQRKLISLLYCKAGTSPSATHFLSNVLLCCKYYPLTAHSALNKYNVNLEKYPFCRRGKGASDGTQGCWMISNKFIRWNIISCIMQVQPLRALEGQTRGV